MIQVTVGNTLSKQKVVVPADTTLRKVLEDNDIDYSTATITFDGCNIKPGDLDKTFADFNVQEKCMLIAVVKADNAR